MYPAGVSIAQVEKLKRSESLLAEAQEIAHIGSWTLDIQSEAVTWSDENYRIHGMRPQEVPMTAELGWSFVHPDDRAALQKIVAKSAQSGEPWECSFRGVRRDGSERIMHSRGHAVFDEYGKPTRMVGTIQDITERTRSEEKLRRNESLLAEAQQIAHIGSWNRDLGSGAIEWSDEHFRIFGFRPQDRLITLELALSRIHSDDRERVRQTVARSIESRQLLESTFRVLHDDGSVRIAHSRGQVSVDGNGKPVRISGTIQDVTEAKRAEEALRGSEERVRLLLESTAEAIYGLDIDGNCTFCNAACVRLLGYRDPNDLLGKPIERLIHRSRHDGSAHANEASPSLAALEGREETHTPDDVLWRADGTSFPAEYWSHPIRRDGEIVGTVVTFLDITERKRLEKEILDVSERERRRLGQDLHDDLCQQLTGIAFTVRLLQQRLAARAVPEQIVAEKLVDAIQHATARARDLAKGLHPVVLEAAGLAAALRELTATLKSVFQVSCRFRCRAGHQRLRFVDPTIAIQLYRIAQESATNAVKHGRAKEIRITIGMVKGRIKLAVADDGVGIIAAGEHHGGMGIPVMYQRARTIGATLTIAPRRRGGTLVRCSLQTSPRRQRRSKNLRSKSRRGSSQTISSKQRIQQSASASDSSS